MRDISDPQSFFNEVEPAEIRSTHVGEAELSGQTSPSFEGEITSVEMISFSV